MEIRENSIFDRIDRTDLLLNIIFNFEFCIAEWKIIGQVFLV